jgi:WD40 repeat protein
VYRDLVRGGEAYDVFLSYSRADSAAAETVRARLKEAGLDAFLDRYGLPAGQPWQHWLEEHLGTCGALVVLVGPSGIGEWQHREIQLGLSRQASAAKAERVFPVIPVLLPKVTNDAIPVGRFLNLNTWVDLRNGLDEPESLQSLFAGAKGRAIEDAAGKLLAGLSPYRGLLPFREQDAGLFFGRERFVEELVRKVGQRSATNVVAVIGRSGSGKSSIVYAGLFPALRHERGLGEQSVWQIVDLRPQAEPLHQLALAFDPPKAEQGSIAFRAQLNEAAQFFRDRKVTLAELVRDRLRDDPGSTRLLLYVDQWEELYTLAAPREPKTEEERARAADAKLFIEVVLEAAAKSSCTLVLSARSDFYPDIQNHDRLRVAVQDSQVSLGTMNEGELRAVIERPPKALGASVDKKLTAKLIRDIGLDPASGRSDEYDIGKLPLLEYALEQAWAKRTGLEIGLPQYTGLEQALEERANALYGRLSAEEQAAAKRLFVSLVTTGEGREDTRARIDMPDDAAMRSVIQTFAGMEVRLIVTDKAGERGSVEVSHEALIRHWKELRAWIDANRENLRTRARLKDDRAEWLKRDKDPDLLGIPSLRLKEVQKLSEEPGDVRTDDITDYIEALLRHDQRRQEKEKQDREAEQRRELELANERAEAARIFAEERVRSEETAQRLRQRAEDAARHADKQRAAALNNETHALAALSRAAAREGRPLDGVELALAAWPRHGDFKRPMLGDAIQSLSLSFSKHPPVAVLSHDGPVDDAIYSPDGKHILSWSFDETLRLWDATTGAAVGEPLQREGLVCGAVYSPDGKRILSWSDDKTVRLWDAAKGAAIGTPLRHRGQVIGAVYSPDGKRILSWSDDKTVRLWDAAKGAAICEPLRHRGPVIGAVYSPDGKRILSASEETLRLWDAATGAAIGKPLRHEGAVNHAVYSPDGKRILSWSDDQTLRLWDAATGTAISKSLRHEGEVNGAAYSLDGARILSWSVDKTLRLWDAATGAAIGKPLRHDAKVNGAVYSLDGTRILSWSDDNTLRLWDAATGAAIGEPLRHERKVNHAVYSPDGKRILSWSYDKTLRLWDGATGAAIGEPLRHEDEVNGAIYSPDGKRILSWSVDKTVRLWDAATGAAIDELLRHEGSVYGAVYSPDGKRILSWSYDKTLRLWDAATGVSIGEPLRHEGSVDDAVYSPDGKRILSWSYDKTLRLWDAATGAAIGEPLRHEGWVWGVVYSPDGKRILSWSEDKTLRLWDAATGAAIGEPLRPEGGVGGAVYSPDGKRILSWSYDKTVRLWDGATGVSIGEPLRHEGPVDRAVYSPDGNRILSWSNDETLRLWNAATGAAIGEPLRHEGQVEGAIYSPDGKRILSWSLDETLRLWNAATGAAIGEPLRRHEGPVSRAVYSPDGMHILSWSSWSSDQTLRLWDAATGLAIGEPLRHKQVKGAVYSPDGKRILSWSDATLKLWDAATGAAIDEPMQHDRAVRGAVYSPDGKRILSWSKETLKLWDVATGAAIGAPLRHGGPVNGAVYSPDGKRILSWSQDKTLRLWDVSWQGDNLLEIACNYIPMMSSKEEMERLSKRYGVKIDEPICQPGVKIPTPDWSRMEPAHAE